MTIKISQFLPGGEMQVNDLVAGLRSVAGTLNDYKFDFPGTGIKDSAGHYLVRWLPGSGTPTNYVQFTSASSTNPAVVEAAGGDDNINLSIGAKGTGHAFFSGTGAFGVPVGTTAQEPTGFAGGLRYDTTTDYLRYWDIGANAWVDIINGAALADLTYVTNTDETADLPNSQPLSALATGIMAVTTGTGIISSLAIPLIATNGGTGIATYTLGDTLYSSAVNTLSKLAGNTTAVKQYLSQTGTGAVSAAPVWSTISGSDITGAALTRVDDTNVTLTLGGTPATALLRATSLTLGWTGLLAPARGGTGVNNGVNTITFGTTVVNPINQNGAQIYAADSVGTDAYAVTLVPAPAAYVDGFMLNVKCGTANTGAATLDVNALGATPITKLNDQALATGDIEANQIITVVYNSSGTARFQMISQNAQDAVGTVTSVGVTSDTLTVTNTPITTSGDIDIELPISVIGFNLLVNGNMQVIQRGNPRAVAASSTVYTMDRWQLLTNANQAYTVTQNDSGVLSGQYYVVLSRNNGQTGTGTVRFCQSLTRDMCRGAAGSTVTVSFEAAHGAGFTPTSNNITVTVYTGTGSTDISGINGAFAGSATVINQTQSISTSFVTYSFTSTTIGATVTQLAVEFSWAPTGTAGVGDDLSIRNVKLEYGDAFTGFNNSSFFNTWQQCQYFYCKSFTYTTTPAQNVGTTTGEFDFIATSVAATQNNAGSCDFPVEMRAAPTLTLFSPGNASAQIYNISAGQPFTGSASYQLTQRTFSVFGTGPAAGAVGHICGVHWTADAELV